MIDSNALLLPYKAKLVERRGRVNDRYESVAEHVFSSLVLARVLSKKIKQEIDEGRASLLILYHDMVEIKTGDTFILDDSARVGKEERERKAAFELHKELPVEIREEFFSCFEEFEANTTWEAKFARAVDALDPVLHSFEDYPAWKKFGFTAANLREKKLGCLKPFPELVELFEELIKVQIEKGVISE